MDSFLNTLQKYHMIQKGETVVIALSGGADSVSLLHLFRGLREEWGLTLRAAHIHHGLRGEEADRDAAFCADLCGEWGVDFVCRGVDVRAEAARAGEGLEACARRLRYEVLKEMAEERGAKIATAHTLHDSMETVLMNMLRGTGLRGLCGIPPVRGRVIRPLIETGRPAIEAYCRDRAIPFVVDSSNLSRAFTRNRIRLDVLPALGAISPAWPATFGRMTANLRADADYLDEQASAALKEARVGEGYSVGALCALPEPIKARALARAVLGAGGAHPQAAGIELLHEALQKGGGVTLHGGLQAFIEHDIIYFSFLQNEEFGTWQQPCTPGVILLFDGVSAHVTERRGEPGDFPPDAIDADRVVGQPIFRNRRPGDVFHPAGRGCGKTLKKLMNEMKIPVRKRPFLPVLADEAGVIWVQGAGCDERVRVTERTRCVFLIRIEGVDALA